MYTVEHSALRIRITQGTASIQFTYENNKVKMEWLHAYTAWMDWQPEGIAHQHLRYALSVLRGFMPRIQMISVVDTTAFLCSTPGGDFLVPLAPFYLSFYGKTWYEWCADATQSSDHEHYVSMRNRQDDPSYRTPNPSFPFEWANSSLASLLYPLYHSVSTWREFFQLIIKKWPSHACGMLYAFIYHSSTDLLTIWIGGSQWNIQMTMDSISPVSTYTSNLTAAPCVAYECTRLSPTMSDVNRWDYLKWVNES